MMAHALQQYQQCLDAKLTVAQQSHQSPINAEMLLLP